MPFRGPRWAATLWALLVLSACHREAATTAQAVNVTIRVARLDTFRDSVTAPGTIVPSPAGDWTLYATEPGQIIELSKKEQDTVAAGEVLVRFDVPSIAQDLANRQIAVTNATRRVDDARSAAARQASLFDRGLAPRNLVDAAKTEQTAAERALAEATTDFQTVNALEDQTVIRARFSGTIVKIWHVMGDQVAGSPSDPILRVVDPAHTQIEAAVPALQLGRVFPGQTATVRTTPDDPGQPATVLTKLPPTSPDAADGRVRLAFATPATLALDTPVTVEMVLGERPNAIFVPASAVLRDATGSYVMIVGDDNLAHRRDVRLGLVTRDVVQLATGISAGEHIIVGGINDVSEGAPVVVGP